LGLLPIASSLDFIVKVSFITVITIAKLDLKVSLPRSMTDEPLTRNIFSPWLSSMGGISIGGSIDGSIGGRMSIDGSIGGKMSIDGSIAGNIAGRIIIFDFGFGIDPSMDLLAVPLYACTQTCTVGKLCHPDIVGGQELTLCQKEHQSCPNLPLSR